MFPELTFIKYTSAQTSGQAWRASPREACYQMPR